MDIPVDTGKVGRYAAVVKEWLKREIVYGGRMGKREVLGGMSGLSLLERTKVDGKVVQEAALCKKCMQIGVAS